MRILKYIYLCTFIVCFYTACVPESKKTLTTVDINVSDPVFQQLMSYEYRAELDSLNLFFSHNNPTYRYLVAKSYASSRNKSGLDSLYNLLNDPVLKVRAMAAYAIGQIGQPESENALLAAFRQKDTISVDNVGNASILEALGKLGSPSLPKFMITASGYRHTDTLLIRAKMKSLYYFALRDIHSEEISRYLIDLLKKDNVDPTTRLYASHCLARSKNLNIETIKFQLAELFADETNKEIKMALALALRHSKDKEIQAILLQELASESDARVKVNIIRALSNYSYIESAEQITELIKSKDLHVAIAACQFLYNNGLVEDVNYYRQLSRDSLPWQVNAQLLKSINKLLPFYYSKTVYSVRAQIQDLINTETDTVAILNYIPALIHDPGAYPWLIDYCKKINNNVITTVGIQTLGEMLLDDNFNLLFNSSLRYQRSQILEFLKESMLSGDEGIIGSAADVISNPKTNIFELIDSTEFLFDAKNILKNPDHIESIHALDKAIAQVRGVENPELTTVAPSRPVNWNLLNEIDSTTKAIVKTNKGSFTIELYPLHAPATVLNFIQLSKEKFYNNKLFHRVVPNFVIQAGSPRGDNYGGMDYVINSELGSKYFDDAGYLGMASAGPNTESCQWFITHSPTPHLDGKYTIFGKVTDGQTIIQNIQIGDIIQDIIITNL